MHSGPVTAGVLRGDRSRFQLFGDTMNTAARMEQSGVKSKIQLSKETANLLINAGKARWVVPRQHTVSPKGKGGKYTTVWSFFRKRVVNVYSHFCLLLLFYLRNANILAPYQRWR